MLFIMMLGMMKNNVLHTLYKYDTDLFINLFCENKALPGLKCHGKCKLNKIEKEQNEDASNRLQQLQTELLSYNEVKQIQFNYASNPGQELIEHTSYYNYFYSFLFSRTFIKPPSLI